MKYTKKRVQLELSEKQLAYLERVADSSGDTISEVIKEFFYIYLQERMLDKEITVIPFY